MKPWIKLEYSLLHDRRIERLVDELGTKGLGVYAIVRLLVECRNDGSITMSELLMTGAEYTSRRILCHVINDYDLFSVGEDGRVHVCVRASVRKSVRESVRESVRTSVRTPKPIIFSKENIDIEGEGEKATTTSSIDSIQKVRHWLIDDGNLIWREPMMMQSGYGWLLQLHWDEAVEFFIQHMLSQDKLGRMYNEHEAKQYFTNFSKIGLPSGKALMEHLSSLQAVTPALPAEKDDGRPPKPTSTAVWCYATDSWVEIH